jgi:arabinogalactan endo-1,4-beta-galactosidase
MTGLTDDGYNLTLQDRWFSSLTATGKVKTSDWDVFGFSFYPVRSLQGVQDKGCLSWLTSCPPQFYGTAATLANLNNTLTTLAKQYGKPLHVVETDW